jgi:hypothetical protein
VPGNDDVGIVENMFAGGFEADVDVFDENPAGAAAEFGEKVRRNTRRDPIVSRGAAAHRVNGAAEVFMPHVAGFLERRGSGRRRAAE